MNKVIRIEIAIAIIILVGIALWFGRGKYDQLFMMSGRFHIINNSKSDNEIKLVFPNQTQASFRLKPMGVIDIQNDNTGEGSITVFVNNQKIDTVGYVTTQNALSILSICDREVSFSQIFNSIPAQPVDTLKPQAPSDR